MKTRKEELEFAIRLLKLLDYLMDIVFERYGEDFLRHEDDFENDEFYEDDEDDFPF